MQFPKKKRRGLKAIRNSLDKYYARFIRLRDTFINDNDGRRYGKCCTSGKFKHISQLDCGHFVSRRWDPVRWDVRNTYAQSKSDNRFRAGEQWKMGVFIDEKHGPGTSAALEAASRNKRRFDRIELEAMEEYFKKAVTGLLKGTKWEDAIK